VKAGGSVVGATVVDVVVVVGGAVVVVVGTVVGSAEVDVVVLGASAVIAVEPPEQAVTNRAQTAPTLNALITAVRGATDEKVPLHSANPRSIALRRMYAFAKKPKWLAGHALFLVLLIIFIAAGFWQLSRHNDRSHRNHAIQDRSSEPMIDLTLPVTDDPDAIEFRQARADGVFDGSAIVVRSKSLDGQPGCHLLGTFELISGEFAVIVNQGWLNLLECESEDVVSRPVDSSANLIEGRIRISQPPGRFGAIDPPDGVLATMARVDLERIQKQTDRPLLPFYLEQTEPVSTSELAPRRLPEPPTDAGPHLGYTVQWFSFAAVALIGYPLVLRKQSRSHNDD